MSKTPEHGYWRSLAELRQDPEYLAKAYDEFSEHAAESPEEDIENLSGISRRRFLALAGASAALAAAACDKLEDRGEIVPYVNQPELTPPGEPRHYASVLTSYPGAPPVLITTREGRPIKMEGNPDHPASNGGLGGYGQSATLMLYDPDRIQEPSNGGQAASWDEAHGAVKQALRQASSSGRRILLVTSGVVSPTTRKLIADFTRAYPGTTHLPIEAFHAGEAAEGRRVALGNDALPQVAWDRAQVVVSLESDFLGAEGSVRDQSGFAKRRGPENEDSVIRLWSVEGPLSLTGSNADHRIRIRPSQQPKFLLGLLHEIAVHRGIGPLSGRRDVADALSRYSLASVCEELHTDHAAASALASDLIEHQGHGAVLAGPRLPATAHAVVAAINVSLGNEGTVLLSAGKAPDVASKSQVDDAVRGMNAGQYGAVVVLGANPAHSLPGGAFAAALANVPFVATAALIPNETTAASQWVLPLAHDLESWGDTDAHAGVLTLQQPGILPLYKAVQAEDMLLAWMSSADGKTISYHDYLRDRWQREVYPTLGAASDFDRVWNAALYDGFARTRDRMSGTPRLNPAAIAGAAAELARIESNGVDVVIAPSNSVYDGRFANSGWLQENPNPITKQVWGNGAVISPAFAKANGIEDGDAVTVNTAAGSLTLPAVVQPGTSDDTVLIELGYGRTVAGSVGSGVGADAGVLLGADGLSPWIYTGGGVSASGTETYAVSRTQEHFNMQGRPLVMESTLDEYRSDSHAPTKELHLIDVPDQGPWEQQYAAGGNRWGMAIDLSLCTGCNGCSVACYSENNIPVVGPEQVSKGREMTWLRLDTYYSGDEAEPEAVHQPMLCQHCENAPCEVVCPVAATTHSADGLNEMAYNRCVGTRYCANNCPYKVRRFNFFNWWEELQTPTELVFNPEVTVRSRGVMEKCSFCVQRIRKTQHDAKEEKRSIRDGELQTACQQACPTDAIVFGDLNDEKSKVAKLAKNPRGYKVLGSLNTQPRVTYLAKIRNPHPDLAHESSSTEQHHG